MYYYSENGKVLGPFEVSDLTGKITPETQVFVEPGVKWVRADELPELQILFAPPPVEDVEIETEQSPIEEEKIIKEAESSEPIIETPANVPIEFIPVNPPSNTEFNTPSKSQSSKSLLFVSIFLILLTGSGFFYFLWLKPYLKDKNAPRKYCSIESLIIRSSKIKDVEYNIVGRFNYSDEVIVYEDDGVWSKIKYDGHENYVASQYLLDKMDFHIMNSIFSDVDSRLSLKTSKCRFALLKYFKQNNYCGYIDNETQIEIFGALLNGEVWQLKATSNDYGPNNVYYPRLSNRSSKFSDFACIIFNPNSGRRKFLLFSFFDDESSFLETEQNAPDYGSILSVYKYYNQYSVSYTKY